MMPRRLVFVCSELARSAFELLNVAEVDGRWHYTFSGAGEVFRVVRPEMSKGMERRDLLLN